MEALILAGGMGTRLQGVVSDVPKCMAAVAGKPFLSYLLEELEKAGFQRVILALGYKSEVVTTWLSQYKTTMKVDFVVEKEPLGTGGAVKLALTKVTEEEVFVLNGDTFFVVPYKQMRERYRQSTESVSIALKKMTNFSRYGAVESDETNHITSFKEKTFCKEGWINGGVYLIDSQLLNEYPTKFSLENDCFEQLVSKRFLTGFRSEGYFIDIGVPEDYEKAQKDFAHGKHNEV